MKPNTQLVEFLSPYSQSIQNLTIELRNYITNLIPEANELIWDNYNAVAMAYSKSEVLKDAFCHISVYAKHVNFGFNRGAELSPNKEAELSPTKEVELLGKGKLIRHIKVTDIDTFKSKEIEALIWEALGISEERNEKLKDKQSKGTSMVMSISEKKIRPK